MRVKGCKKKDQGGFMTVQKEPGSKRESFVYTSKNEGSFAKKEIT